MNVGRNDPCPCGSGKKYKRCCLAQDEATEHAKAALEAAERRRRSEAQSFAHQARAEAEGARLAGLRARQIAKEIRAKERAAEQL